MTSAERSMLEGMAAVYPNKGMLAAMLALLDASTDQLRFMMGPVVVHNSPWMADTPAWLYEAIPAERLSIILDELEAGEESNLVGPTEITAVMMPVTMDHPLGSTWTDIYLWAASRATAARDEKDPEEVMADLEQYPITDDDIGPGGRLNYDYRRLCSDIRAKVIKHQAGRDRASKREAKAAAAEAPAPVVVAEPIGQGSLFD